MRIVLIGAGTLTVETARILIRRGYDVVIVDRDKARIDELSETLDCGLIFGEGTKPAVLREIGPGGSDVLMCLTDNDQDNILASLVGRSLGFPEVITRIGGSEFEQICLELGLTGTIIPDQATARALADRVEGRESVDLSTIVKNDLRFFSFIAREEDAVAVGELTLPARTRVVCLYRGEDFILPEPTTHIEAKDQVVLATHRKTLDELHERFEPKPPA